MIIIINKLVPVKQSCFTRLSALLVLTDRGILAQSNASVVDGWSCPWLGGPTGTG